VGFRRLIFLVLFLSTVLSHFSQSGSSLNDSILSGGLSRKYWLYVPTSYNGSKSYPLVINLHGLSMSAPAQQIYANFMPIADTANFLVVQPEGSFSGSTQFWNVGLLSTPNDVIFIRDLIDSLSLLYNIDKDSVYSCGLSNGAILSYYLVCNLPNKIAAIASVAGTMFRPWFEGCKPMYATPVMEIHGTEDGTVPFEGNSSAGQNGIYMPIDTVIQKWVVRNKCNPVPVIKQVPDIDASDFSTAVNYRYKDGIDGSEVELYKVIGGSHSWPGASPFVFHTNEDFNASLAIWRFFRKFGLKQFTTNVGLREQQELRVNVRLHPNPCADKLFVETNEDLLYSVFDLQGSMVIGETKGCTLEVQALSPGLYFLKAQKGLAQAMFKFIKE
jgi:polyhydroxybutyrate depolymerase